MLSNSCGMIQNCPYIFITSLFFIHGLCDYIIADTVDWHCHLCVMYDEE